MEKPKFKQYQDIHKAIEWVERKLGKELSDKDPSNPNYHSYTTYLEFLGEHREASQGSLIRLPSVTEGPPWVQEATKTFEEEFGEDCLYYYWW